MKIPTFLCLKTLICTCLLLGAGCSAPSPVQPTVPVSVEFVSSLEKCVRFETLGAEYVKDRWGTFTGFWELRLTPCKRFRAVGA
jgi:hypothetical protein